MAYRHIEPDKERVYVCEKCKREELVRYPKQNIRCRECGGKMHKTDRKI